eukprot:1773522-Rhodomonas_salina.1
MYLGAGSRSSVCWAFCEAAALRSQVLWKVIWWTRRCSYLSRPRYGHTSTCDGRAVGASSVILLAITRSMCLQAAEDLRSLYLEIKRKVDEKELLAEKVRRLEPTEISSGLGASKQAGKRICGGEMASVANQPECSTR